MTDETLEAEIDRVGRDKVFGMVIAAGWEPPNPVPKAIWWQAVNELRRRVECEGTP